MFRGHTIGVVRETIDRSAALCQQKKSLRVVFFRYLYVDHTYFKIRALYYDVKKSHNLDTLAPGD